MKKEYDFSQGQRGPIIESARKKRITICLDNDIIESFRDKAEEAGYGYQTMINEALRQYLAKDNRPVDQCTLRKILREELNKAG